MRPLRPDARARLADPADRPEWSCRATKVSYTRQELRSLRELFAAMPDCRRGQGRKHRLETVLTICALARLSGLCGPVATERFAKRLDQEELRALGAWRDPVAGRWVAPSDSTICRVVADADPDALAEVLGQWAAPRLAEAADTPALAADGKRIRGANRHTNDDTHFETVTLVTHAGHPPREPLLPRRRGRDRRDPGAAGGCRCARLPDHPGRPAHHPRHRAGDRRDARRRLSARRQGQLPRDDSRRSPPSTGMPRPSGITSPSRSRAMGASTPGASMCERCRRERSPSTRYGKCSASPANAPT